MRRWTTESAARAGWLVAGLLAAATASAQLGQPSVAQEAGEAPPVYEVEILIFAYQDFNPQEEEFPAERPTWPKALRDVALRATPETLQPGSADWYLDDVTLPAEPVSGPLAAPTPPETGAAEPFTDDAPASGAPVGDHGSAIGAAPAPAQQSAGPWFRLLEPDRLELDRAFARLSSLGAYTPLLHTGWSQPVLLEAEAEAFELGRLGRLQPAGSIKLHRSRFLHLTLDVSLQDSYRYVQLPLEPDAHWPLAEFVGPVRYRIAVQRRVRAGEVNFFDHPAFGVLVTVRPAPEPSGTDTDEPAGPAA